MSNFDFLEAEWPAVYEAASKAEAAVYPDPRAAGFYARRALELAVRWLYTYDGSLKTPYADGVSALIHEPTFKASAGKVIFMKARFVNTTGNQAVHSEKEFTQDSALGVVRELFQVSYWLAHTYGTGTKPAAELEFDKATLPQTAPIPKQTIAQLQELARQLQESDQKLAVVIAEKLAASEELIEKHIQRGFILGRSCDVSIKRVPDE